MQQVQTLLFANFLFLLIMPNHLKDETFYQYMVFMRDILPKLSDKTLRLETSIGYLVTLDTLFAQAIERAGSNLTAMDFTPELALAAEVTSDYSKLPHRHLINLIGLKLLHWQLLAGKDGLDQYLQTIEGNYHLRIVDVVFFKPGSISQLTQIMMTLSERGVTDQDARFQYLLGLLDQTVKTNSVQAESSALAESMQKHAFTKGSYIGSIHLQDLHYFLRHQHLIKTTATNSLARFATYARACIARPYLFTPGTQADDPNYSKQVYASFLYGEDMSSVWHQLVNQSSYSLDDAEKECVVAAFWDKWIAPDLNATIPTLMSPLIGKKSGILSMVEIFLFEFIADGRANQLSPGNKKLVVQAFIKQGHLAPGAYATINCERLFIPIITQFMSTMTAREQLLFAIDIINVKIRSVSDDDNKTVVERITLFAEQVNLILLMRFVLQAGQWKDYLAEYEVHLNQRNEEHDFSSWPDREQKKPPPQMQPQTITKLMASFVKFSKNKDDFELYEANTDALPASPVVLASEETAYKPILLQLYLQTFADNERHQVLIAYNQFHQRCFRANRHARERGKVPFEDMMDVHVITVIDLIEMMGFELAFEFCGSMVKTSLVSLQRFFEKCQRRDPVCQAYLQQIFAQVRQGQWQHTYKQHEVYADVIISCQSLMEVIDLSADRLALLDNFVPVLAEALAESSTINELRYRINQLLLTLFSKQMGIEFTALNAAFSPNYASKLLLARLGMQGNSYQAVFNEMLRADLDVTQGYAFFAHSLVQPSTIGRSVATFNARTRGLLANAKIDVSTALQYPRKMRFSCEDNGQADIGKWCEKIYSLLSHLGLALVDCMKSCKAYDDERGLLKKLISVKKRHDNLNFQLQKGNRNMTQEKQLRVLNTANQQALDSLLRSFAELKAMLSPTQMQEEQFKKLFEFTEHVQQNNELMRTVLNKNNGKVSRVKKREFYLEHWDKSLINTLFLGDYVSCCLGTDKTRFYAMVQRRIDDAMQFHVVRAADSDEVVALNWVFLAHDQANPQDVYVVVNFVEIRAGLGLNKSICDAVFCHLLLYTEEYSRIIGAKGMLLRPLDYGFMADKDQFLPKKKIAIDKVGGFFALPGEDVSTSALRYFLEGLSFPHFGLVTAEVVEQQFGVAKVDALIEPQRLFYSVPQASNASSQSATLGR